MLNCKVTATISIPDIIYSSFQIYKIFHIPHPAFPKKLVLWYWIISSIIPGVALQKSLCSKPNSLQNPESFHCLICIMTAGWMKTTNPATPKPRRNAVIKGKNPLIKPY
jgi:hypothetical protein